MAPVMEDRNRAQLVLIGALALAVSLVVIALVLNSAIYTHNLASRYQSPADSPATFARDASLGAGDAMTHANRNHPEHGFSAVMDNYTRGLSDLEDGSGRYAAANGRTVRTDHITDSQVEGVWIADLESGGSTFEDANESLVDWYVAREVRIRQYRMVVNNSSIANIDRSDAEDITEDPTLGLGFVIEIDDGSQVWRMAPYDNDGRVNLMVHRDGSSTWRVCRGSNQARIDYMDALVNNEPCKPLGFFDNLDGTYDVRYWYGGLAVGQYEMIADRVIDGESSEAGPMTDVVDTANYGHHCGDGTDVNGDEYTFYPATSSNYPRVSPAIYEAQLDVSFDGPDTTHETVRRVAPDTVGDERQEPRVTRFEVTDHSNNGHANFSVDWSATDPDGNLDTLDLSLDGDTTTITLSNPDAESGSTFLNESNGGGGQYTIAGAVYDGDGYSRSTMQEHEADADDTGCPP